MVAAGVAIGDMVAIRTMMIIDAVRDLYRAHWGEPSRRARFEIGDWSIEVYKWAADANPEGVALYATVGTSERPMPSRDAAHRVEFLLGLMPERDDVASALAALGLYPAREGVALDHGHTVPADGPLWPGTAMCSFLVLHPLSDFLPPLELPGGLHVEFLQAVPVFDAERAFKSKHGAEALLEIWERASVPFWDPRRASAIA